MSQSVKRLFEALKDKNSTSFEALIIIRLGKEARKISLRRFLVLGLFSFLSLLAIFYSGRYIILELNQSGFGQYLSLLFSDGDKLIVDWKEFTFSLLESAPFIGAIVFLSGLLVLLSVLKLAMKKTWQKVPKVLAV